MSIYIMSLFRLPKGVRNRLEKIQRDFLWGGGNLDRQIHYVNWNVVCYGKENGGLGIRSLYVVNRALLGKWVWRFAKEEESIWKEIIRLKYQVEDGGWFTKIPRENFGVGLWKDISKENMQMKLDNIFVLGDGRRISFWEDTWCSEAPLCEILPTLYSLAVTKGAKVADMWDFSRWKGAWIPSFVRPLNDWKMHEAHNFLCLLNSRRVNQEEKRQTFLEGGQRGHVHC